MSPVNISGCSLQGPRDWGGFCFGLSLWDFRFFGGFVLPYRWFVLGYVLEAPLGGGPDLSYRWFAFGVGFGRSD